MFAPSSSVYPIVLPQKGPLSRLVARHSHEHFYHASKQSMRKTIRQEFWIIQMELLIRTALKSCVDCNKANSESSSQGLGPLGMERLSLKQAYPLHTIAIDVFGHFEVKNQWLPREQNYPLALIIDLELSKDGFNCIAKIRFANYQPLNKRILNKREKW